MLNSVMQQIIHTVQVQLNVREPQILYLCCTEYDVLNSEPA